MVATFKGSKKKSSDTEVGEEGGRELRVTIKRSGMRREGNSSQCNLLIIQVKC